MALGSKLIQLQAAGEMQINAKELFSAQQLELFLLYMIKPVQPTVSQPSFHVPSPIWAPEGGSEEKEEEETQAEEGESESMRQLDATLTPSTLLS